MIEFDKETHTYTLDGKTLIPVTQLMKKHGLSTDYSGIDSEVLRRAAERGTLVHKEIEEYCKTGEPGFTDEMANFAEHIEKEHLKVLASEKICYDDMVAGTIDLILEKPNGRRIIADIKTTSALNVDAVSWQLSIYAYLIGWTVSEAQEFHFDRSGALKAVDVPFKPYEEVERLMQCERDGVLYQQNLSAIVTDQQIAAIEAAERIISEAEADKKAAEDRIAEIKAQMMAAMEENAVKTFETDRIKVTYIAPSERTSIDTARLKKEKPEIAEQYSKTTKISASVRITMKKGE